MKRLMVLLLLIVTACVPIDTKTDLHYEFLNDYEGGDYTLERSYFLNCSPYEYVNELLRGEGVFYSDNETTYFSWYHTEHEYSNKTLDLKLTSRNITWLNYVFIYNCSGEIKEVVVVS